MLLVGALAATFTRQPDPVSPNGRNIAGEDRCLPPESGAATMSSHILKQRAGYRDPDAAPDGAAADRRARRDLPHALLSRLRDHAARRGAGAAGGADLGHRRERAADRRAASLGTDDYNFPVWADPVYADPTTEDVSTACHAVAPGRPGVHPLGDQSCVNTTLDHRRDRLGVKFAHYAAIEKSRGADQQDERSPRRKRSARR